MDTQARPLRKNRYALLLERPWASRLIATLGIVVVTVGMYAPFAGRDWIAHNDPASHQAGVWAITNMLGVSLAYLPVGRVLVLLYLGVDALFSALTLGGLVLISFLWRPLSPKGSVRLRWAYAAWLSLLIILAVASFFAWRQFITQPVPGEPAFISYGPPYILPGVVVFPLGVLMSCGALALLFREPLPTSSPAIAPRTGGQWAAALTMTAGVLVWIIGFYLMPEAITTACPPITFSVTQFAHGACAGIDSDQVLQHAYYAGLNPVAFLLYTLGRHFEILVAGGCLTALGGWTRQLSWKTLVWLAAWPALALGVAFVALQGVNVVAQHGFQLTVDTGAGWHMAPGMAVTFAGISLVLLGEIFLWREMVKRSRAARAR